MQRVNRNALLGRPSPLSIGALALMAAFMLFLGTYSGTTDKAEAATDARSGVYDILVAGGSPPEEAQGWYHCISYINDDGANVQSTSQCYDNVGFDSDPNGEPPDAPNEGPDGPDNHGPKPPPPYTTLMPSVSDSAAISGTSLTQNICFPDVGGVSGPNLIWVVTDANYTTDFSGDGRSTGTLALYFNQPNAACAALTPVGGSFTLPVVLYRVADKNGTTQDADAVAGCAASWRAVITLAGCTNWDGDGCKDAAELTGPHTSCGDDPFNPYDSLASVTGSWSVLAQVVKENCTSAASPCYDAGPNFPVGGFYYECTAVFEAGGSARASCYLDSPGLSVNSDGYNAPASPGDPDAGNCKGDGKPGAAPPGKIVKAGNPANCDTGPLAETGAVNNGQCAGNTDNDADKWVNDGCPGSPNFDGSEIGTQCDNILNDDADANGAVNDGCPAQGDRDVFRDINLKHTVLTGTITAPTISLKGCFEDDDDHSSLGNLYWDATINFHTGVGSVLIYGFGTGAAARANCTAAVPVLPAPAGPYTLLTARQSSDLLYDADEDGCTDYEELGLNRNQCGLRDPLNRFDYYDIIPAGGNCNIGLFQDIFGVAGIFGAGPDKAVPPAKFYIKSYDRGPKIPGSNRWNLSEPDGTIDLFNDIFGVAAQFGDSCAAALPAPTHLIYYFCGLTDNTTTAALNASQTKVSVSDGHQFSASDIIKIDNEQMEVVSTSGNTSLTVTRGYNGTPAKTHATGRSVRLCV